MLRKNLALATIVTAPSPATSGTSLVVTTGEAARFPVPATDGDFYATLFPANEIPHIGNAEIVKVTAVSTDTFTIVRAQRGSTAKAVEAGWLMIQGIYAEDFDDYGGWLTTGISGVIVTRESTDDPTVVLRFDADVRDYIWKGMRIKATENSIVHYFIVSKDPELDGDDTLVTCLSEIDTSTPTQAKNLIGATTISDVAYAPPKTYPKGFPIENESWSIKVVDSSDAHQSNPTQNMWYNPGSISIEVPIGDFFLTYSAAFFVEDNDSSFMTARATLSTANNSESNSERTVVAGGAASGSGSYTTRTSIYNRSFLSQGSKATMYLNAQTQFGGASNVGFSGSSRHPTVIRATSTLL